MTTSSWISNTVLAAVSLCAASIGCSSGAELGDGTGGGDGGAASSHGVGAGGSSDDECHGAMTAVFGVPETDEGCLDAEVARVVCLGSDLGPGLVCVQSKVDGTRLWLGWFSDVVDDTFEPCSDADVLPPVCGLAACDNRVASTCTMQATRAHFGCGDPESARDEQCCLRPSCSGEADCADGESCQELSDFSYGRSCAPSLDGSCGCWGLTAGKTVTVCAPE